MGKVREVSGAESGLQVWQTGEHLLQLKGTVAASFRGVLPRDDVTPGLPEFSFVFRSPNPEFGG